MLFKVITCSSRRLQASKTQVLKALSRRFPGTFQALSTSSIQGTFDLTKGAFDLTILSLFKAITGFYDSSTQGAFKALPMHFQGAFQALSTSSSQGAFDLTLFAFKALSTYNESTYSGFNRR
jgi:hypothetical protein